MVNSRFIWIFVTEYMVLNFLIVANYFNSLVANIKVTRQLTVKYLSCESI